MLSLKIEMRDMKLKPETLQKKGLIPAVFYGKKEKSTPIMIALNEFTKVLKKAGESSVITLKQLNGEDLEALIYDVDLHPVTEVARHADFYIFEKGHKISMSIPLVFEGSAPAVKDLGGTLIKVLHELKIEAMPKDLPHEIKVDISPLVNFESRIFAKDIALPSGAVLKEISDEIVALISEAKEEVMEEFPVDLSAIEVEKKGKKEEEGEAEGGAPEAPSKFEEKAPKK